MINLYNRDCMEALKEFKDNQFHLAIVDPPYGVNFKTSSSKMFKNTEPTLDYWNELKRVSKNQIAWGVNYYKNSKLDGGRIIWNKLGQYTTKRKQVPNMSDAEIAYQSFNKLSKMFSYAWVGNVTGYNYKINSKEFRNRIHPTQKPVKLYEWLLMNYAKEGDNILDTHLGSGSIAIACHNLGFDLTGYELDTEYFEAAQKRLKQHQSQIRIF